MCGDGWGQDEEDGKDGADVMLLLLLIPRTFAINYYPNFTSFNALGNDAGGGNIANLWSIFTYVRIISN